MAWLGAAVTLATSPIGQSIASAIAGAVHRQTSTALNREDIQIATADVPAAARAATDAVVPSVVTSVLNTIISDPVIGPAINKEGAAQSVNVWLGVAGMAGAIATAATLMGNHDFNMTALSGAGLTFVTSFSIVWRRVRLGWALNKQLGKTT